MCMVKTTEHLWARQLKIESEPFIKHLPVRLTAFLLFSLATVNDNVIFAVFVAADTTVLTPDTLLHYPLHLSKVDDIIMMSLHLCIFILPFLCSAHKQRCQEKCAPQIDV